MELAGEIATEFPEKAITVVHDGPRLLEFMGPKASEKALKWLISKGVQVKLNETIDVNDMSEGTKKSYRTSKGDVIRADCHFACGGRPLGSAWLHKTILKSNLDGHGRLMVDGYLRVKGRNNVFAIGDITDIRVSALISGKYSFNFTYFFHSIPKNLIKLKIKIYIYIIANKVQEMILNFVI